MGKLAAGTEKKTDYCWKSSYKYVYVSGESENNIEIYSWNSVEVSVQYITE
jgi:hypothetical protein